MNKTIEETIMARLDNSRKVEIFESQFGGGKLVSCPLTVPPILLSVCEGCFIHLAIQTDKLTGKEKVCCGKINCAYREKNNDTSITKGKH